MITIHNPSMHSSVSVRNINRLRSEAEVLEFLQSNFEESGSFDIDVCEDDGEFRVFGDDGTLHLGTGGGLRICFDLGQETPRRTHVRFCRSLINFLDISLNDEQFEFLVDCTM